MPEGVVQWFDPATGEAAIVRGGHVFRAAVADIQSVARHPGARVHFDIHRDGGAERAVDVTLRPGTRTSHGQRGFGTLTGARRPDTKGPAPFAHAHPERGRALASHPLEVARAWVEYLRTGDLDGALSLYARDAVVHGSGADHVGRSHIGAYLEASPLFGREQDAEIRGEDRAVLLRWAGLEVRGRVEHGLLAEQWVEPAAPARVVELPTTAGAVPFAVVTRGPMDDDEVGYAVERIRAVLDQIDDPVLFARLKLTRAGDPARAKPAIVQVSLDLNGDMLRAHVAAHGMQEAADLLQQRLRAKLEQRAQHREALRTRSGMPDPGQWRHGDLPTARPEHFDRPPEERLLVRHKSFATGELTPDEAAFDMDALDHDFHLFRDLATGEDAMLERLPGGGYRLTLLQGRTVEPAPSAIELVVADTSPPELSVQEAIERLRIVGEDFLYFANRATRRGNVIYRRYDGHYGLVALDTGGDARGQD
jgi:hypothetical protein